MTTNGAAGSRTTPGAAARISRRRMLQGSAAAATSAALLAAGCSDNSQPSTPPTPAPTANVGGADVLNAAGPPRHGGRLASANPANFGTFDPHLGVAVASAYFPRLYNMLLNQSATKPEWMFLDLAESYEVPDEQTFIFNIRPGVKVTPNDLDVPERDLDAEDVRRTMERISTDPGANNHSFANEYIESVKVDGNRVTMRTTKPYAWFLNRIGLFFNAIVPRELLEGDLTRLTNAAAGAGPFRLRRVAENDHATFDRNPNYYRRDESNNNAQLPYVDGLDVSVIFDRATLRTAFNSGQIHSYMTGSGAEARSLSDAVIARDPFFAFIAFTMSATQKPFDDPRVRRAISRAIDRKPYVDIIYGGDAKPDGLVQWSLGAYALSDAELERYQPFNLEEARALVREVGGIKFPMVYPDATSVLEHSEHLPIFLEQMRAADIDVELKPQDFGRWIETLRNQRYISTLNLNQIYETPEIPLAIHTENGPFGDGTYLRGLGIPEIEEAVRKVNSSLDYDERVTAVHDAQRIIYENDPVSLPLVTPYLHIAWRNNVHNIPAGIGTSAYMVNTYWLDA